MPFGIPQVNQPKAANNFGAGWSPFGSQPSVPSLPVGGGAAPAPAPAPAPMPSPTPAPPLGAPTDQQMLDMGWVKDASGNWIQPLPDDGFVHATGAGGGQPVGGGGVPGSQPGDWGGFNNGAPATPPETGPGAPPAGGTPPATPPAAQDPLAALFEMFMPGAQGIFQGSDLAPILPGRSKGSDNIFALLLNMMAQQAQAQQGRSEQAEGIYSDLAGANAPALGLSEDAMGLARSRIDPASLSGYRDMLRGQAASDAGQAAQTSMQRLRDAGMLGRGSMGVDPALAASNLANRQLSDQNLQIEGLMENLTQNRLGQAGQLATGGADIYQNLKMIPQYNLAQQLFRNPNPALAQMQELLNQLAQAGMTGDIAHRNAPSDFERIGAPLIGGVLGAASSPLAALLGKG